MSLPAPLVSREVDLRDFAYTPVFRSRLFGSSFHAHASDGGWRAGVTLWLKSWDQSPAGSLPDNDVELCRLAELGRDIVSWSAVKEEALWGWSLHSDGRFYHKIVAEGVNKAWQEKVAQRDRTAAARKAKLEKQRTTPVTDSMTEVVTEDSAEPVTETVTSSKGSKVKGRDIYRRATRLPEEWTLPEEWRRAALSSGLTENRINYQAAKFKNHWLAKAGKDAARLDWKRTWDNWIMDDVTSAKPDVRIRPSRPQMEDAMAGLILTLPDDPLP